MECLRLTLPLSDEDDGERFLPLLRVSSRDFFAPPLGLELTDEEELLLDCEEEEGLRLRRLLLVLLRPRPRWEDDDEEDFESVPDDELDDPDEDNELLSELLEEVDEETDESSSFFLASASC